MNTGRSVGYGWLVLIAAGGGAYYFAKKNINADREAKHRQSQERRALNARYSEMEMQQGPTGSASSGGQHGGASPSAEAAAAEPAPTKHASTGQEAERSKYEPTEVWRSKKGDRLR